MPDLTAPPRTRPILFSAPMVRALLAGAKTQTRRIMKPQPLSLRGNGRRVYADADFKKAWEHIPGIGESLDPYADSRYGRPGDRLWVRETCAIEMWCRDYGKEPPLPTDRPWKQEHFDDDGDYWYWPHYRATDPTPDLTCESARCRTCTRGEPGAHWTPSIHMPRWASRITLEITDVRVQRVQEISDVDAFAEGIQASVNEGALGDGTARSAFRVLWESINGVGSWDANPWVWALTFRRITGEGA